MIKNWIISSAERFTRDRKGVAREAIGIIVVFGCADDGSSRFSSIAELG